MKNFHKNLFFVFNLLSPIGLESIKNSSIDCPIDIFGWPPCAVTSSGLSKYCATRTNLHINPFSLEFISWKIQSPFCVMFEHVCRAAGTATTLCVLVLRPAVGRRAGTSATLIKHLYTTYQSGWLASNHSPHCLPKACVCVLIDARQLGSRGPYSASKNFTQVFS